MLFELLGVKLEGRHTWLTWHEHIVAGLPGLAVHRLAKALDVSVEDLAALVDVPAEAAAWQQRGKPLSLDASNSLFRIASAFHRITVVLKDPAQCAQWLRNPQKELGNNTPIVLLLSHPGAEEVFACIDRLIAQQKPKMELSREEYEAVTSILTNGEEAEEREEDGEAADEALDAVDR